MKSMPAFGPVKALYVKKKSITLLLLLVFVFSAGSQEDVGRLLNIVDGILNTAEEKLSSPSGSQDMESLSFIIVNNTGFTIRSIFVCKVNESNWGSNVLFNPLYNGQNVSINLEVLDSTARYNIRLIDVDGDSYSKYNIALNTRSRVRVGIDDFEF